MESEKRLINVWKLVIDLAKLEKSGQYDHENVLSVIASQETVDAVEVVHGRWISKGRKIECSVCEHRAFLGTTDPVIHKEEKNIRKYCHNCGAKMDK